MNVSPCLSCTRVAQPRECENKNCKAWRSWFVGRWDALRIQPRLSMEKVKTEPEGVCIGGETYALPHRVKGYLESDPCEKCLCPRDLCTVPCKIKRNWKHAREDVLLQ